MTSLMKTFLLPVAVLLAAPLAAQQTTVATETFDYAVGSLSGLAGGTGWANSWYVETNASGVDAAQVTTPGFDTVGEKATTQFEHGGSYRLIDTAAHPSILDNGVFGKDGTTFWISFQCQREWWSSDWYGGIGLFHQFNGNEKLFMGSPWGADEWGFEAPFQNLPQYYVGGTNCAVLATLVYRIDFQAGDERVRLWIDPATSHPTTVADLDQDVPDFRFNEIRMQSGSGGQAGFSFDEITFEYEGSAPTPALAISGSCPGPGSADASGMTPGGPVAFYYAIAAGSVTLPSGGCAGLTLPVSSPTQLGGFVNADAAGNASLAGTMQANHCGLVILGAVDIATCGATNTVAL